MFLAPSITGVVIATVVAFLVLTLLLVALLLFTKQKLSRLYQTFLPFITCAPVA